VLNRDLPFYTIEFRLWFSFGNILFRFLLSLEVLTLLGFPDDLEIQEYNFYEENKIILQEISKKIEKN
jgi:hypothetical protein